MLKKDGYQVSDFLADAERIGLAQMRKRMILVAWRTKKEWEPVAVQNSGAVLRDVLKGINGASNHNMSPIEFGSDLHTIAKQIKPGQKLSNVRGGARSVHTWDIPDIYGKTTEK